MKIPCLKNTGLNIFTTTADQRIMLGKETFLRTHFQARYRRYRGEKLVEEWQEEDILNRLRGMSKVVHGNRVFVLFGAAGSGKSESIRWLETQINSINKPKAVVRISRTELDPVKIMQKLLAETTGKTLDRDILIKWENLRKKPVTLANSLVWNSLSMLLENDEAIIPISYKLRPIIEQNLRNCFSDIDKKVDLAEKVLEIISLEELEQVVTNCSLSINIDYEQLRRLLVERLEAEILGGYSFVKTIQEVGVTLEKTTGSRPVLLIDDLVQSMNLYSSDLLDFFITFEEGNWDIIIGLTPASFEATKRGRELLTRINHLDTMDDRIIKLWLTDEFGQESYTVNRTNSADYIMKYLVEYKRINGYTCGQNCSNFNKCNAVQWGKFKDIGLTPLNRHLCERIYSSLFKGKGQARHFVISVGEYLDALLEGKGVDFIVNRVKREKCLDLEDNSLRIQLEALMPLKVKEELEVEGDLLRILGKRYARKEIISVTPLELGNLVNRKEVDFFAPSDPEVSAIRDWLENRPVNKELLKKFRLACGNFLRELSLKPGIVRQYTSRPNGVIHREKILEGSRLPISIEEVDGFIGISVNRKIGHLAFQMFKLAEPNCANQTSIINQLLNNGIAQEMLSENARRNGWQVREIEKELAITCFELAYLLYAFILHISHSKSYPRNFASLYQLKLLAELPDDWSERVGELVPEDKNFVEDFFKDWFQLRENMYDAVKINECFTKYRDITEVLEGLAGINVANLSEDFKVRNTSLKILLSRLIILASQYLVLLKDKQFQKFCYDTQQCTIALDQLDELQLKCLQKRLISIFESFLALGRNYGLPNEWYNNFRDGTPEENGFQDFPYCIPSIVRESKNSRQKWLWQTMGVIQLIQYDTMRLEQDLINKKLKIMPNSLVVVEDYIDSKNTSVKAMNIVEIVDFAHECLNRSKKLLQEYKILNESEEYLTSNQQALISDFLFLIDNLGIFISPIEYEIGNLNKEINLAHIYNEIKAQLSSGQMIDSDHVRVLREVCEVLTSKNISIMKSHICDSIIFRLRANELLSDQRNSWGHRSLVRDLTLIGKGTGCRDLYVSVGKRLKKRQLVLDMEYAEKHLTQKGISIDSANLVIHLLKGKVVRDNLNNISLEELMQIKDSIPSICKLLECTLALKSN